MPVDQLATPVVSTRDTIPARAEHLLTGLGDTPSTIAATLAAAGIRGERLNENTCPIATFLMRSDLGLHSVDVDGIWVVLHFGDEGSEEFVLGAPTAVKGFVDRFDEGAYDNLLKTSCVRCKQTPAGALCCSSHNALLCHGCYRRTHFVEVCVEGCNDCAREGLGVSLGGVR